MRRREAVGCRPVRVAGERRRRLLKVREGWFCSRYWWWISCSNCTCLQFCNTCVSHTNLLHLCLILKRSCKSFSKDRWWGAGPCPASPRWALEGWIVSGAEIIMICVFQDLPLSFVELLAMAYQACHLLWQGFFWHVKMTIHYNTKNVCIAQVSEQRNRDFKCSFSCFSLLWVWGTCSLAKYMLLSCFDLLKNLIVSLATLHVMKPLPLPSGLFLLLPQVNFLCQPARNSPELMLGQDLRSSSYNKHAHSS